jgi:hypothetical protein
MFVLTACDVLEVLLTLLKVYRVPMRQVLNNLWQNDAKNGLKQVTIRRSRNEFPQKEQTSQHLKGQHHLRRYQQFETNIPVHLH